MFYELMSYDVIPGRAAEFLELCRSRGLPIRGEKYGRLEGFWRVDIGRQYQVMHLWSHASVEARQTARLKMAEDQAWQTDFLPYCLPLMVEGETRFMSALAPLTPPPAASGIYEIRFTTTRPLKGRSWFQDQTAARAAHCVGAWQNIAGRPYEIITLL
ncbi:MAG: NIPSNAP family protein, partial [Alphaproteobacteria bacterium]